MDRQDKRKLQLLYRLCQRLGRNISDQSLTRLSREQLEYINQRLRLPCYVEACPGSGKTEIVGIKAAYEFASWRERFTGIAILTFTRSAAAEIRGRVIQYAGSKAARHPHFIGTIDSWFHNYLLQPFAHAIIGYPGKAGDKSVRIVENESRAGFLNIYRVIGSQSRPILANEYCVRYDEVLEGIIRSIDGFDPDRLRSTKSRFLRDGFVTYQDAESVCYQVLEKYPTIVGLLSRRFPHIIVDECQDLSDTQLRLFYKLLRAGSSLHLVGDLNQAIYEFRKVNPDHVASFVQKQGFLRKTLTNNYRSNQKIVNFFSSLIRSPRRIQGCESVMWSTPCILWQYTDGTFEYLPECFDNLVREIGLDTHRCCIVARGTARLKQLRPQKGGELNAIELFADALNCWYLPNRAVTEIGIALHSVGKSLSLLAYSGRGHHQKQYCPDGVDSMVWRLFLADVLDGANHLCPFAQDLTWSHWATDLGIYLERIWPFLPVKGDEWSSVSGRIRAPRNRGGTSMAGGISLAGCSSNLRITTIHDVKGETLDALLLISSRDRHSKGGHFEQWLHPSPGNEEYRRFAYVACSRPRHLLVIATPRLNREQLGELIGLGLEAQDMLSWRPSKAAAASVGDGTAA